MARVTFYILFLCIAITSCKTQSTGEKTRGANVVASGENGDEHELLILDPGFDRWFSINRRPANYHSLSFYESQNQRYVRSWNEKVSQQGYYRSGDYPFTDYIQYNFDEDYGLELNYMLYHYFQYIEDGYGRRFNFPD